MSISTLPGGDLIPIRDCYIIVPVSSLSSSLFNVINFGTSATDYSKACVVPRVGNAIKVELNNLPDITDSKSVAYNDEVIIGRSTPLKTFSHSENRSISMQIHLHSLRECDVEKNIAYIRALSSVLYPTDGDKTTPYIPPPVCRMKCGRLFSDSELCVVLKNMSIKYPTDVVWDERTYLPIKLDIDTTWDVVYSSAPGSLPGQARILNFGS